MKKMRHFLLFLLVQASFFTLISAQELVPQQATLARCISDVQWQKLPAHPRLFANDARIAALKLQKDSVSKTLFLLLKQDAEKTLLADKIVYPTEGFKFGAMRTVQGRILTLSLSYRVFGDKRYLERAKAELMQLAELPDWCPGHFLDVGEATLAAAVGLDWLYKELSAAERAKISQAIVKNGIIPSLDVKESNNNTSWLNGNFNWNPVCNGGLLVGALAIYETEPELARQIVERSIKYIPFAGADYSPDGASSEGPSYWSYGTSFYVIAIEALRSALGSSCELEKIPGFLKTADYNNQMVGATGQDFNYSDYHVENLNEPVMFWFGRELKRSDLIQDELSDLSRLQEKNTTGQNAKPGKKVEQSRHFPLEILWWEPALLQKGNTSSAPLHWAAKGGLPIGVMRSAWNDPNATYLAIKGGTPNNSHGHMDVGSFILEADGVRWALDLGTENYNKMRAAKLDLWNYSQHSNRWSTFRCGPEGHNILRFDTARQDISGFGTIQELPADNGAMGNLLDLSSLYKSKVDKISRTVKMWPDRSISIEDQWTTGGNPVEASFQWLTKAKATLKPDGILLEQDGKFLSIKVEAPGSNLRPEILIEDVSKAKNLQDSDNPGLSRIVIRLKTPANSHSILNIKAIPGDPNRLVAKGATQASKQAVEAPKSGFTFSGQTEAEIAKKAALEKEYLAKARQNIEAHRKGDASLTFVDAAGQPLKNAKVEINQLSQDFLFGNLSEEMFSPRLTPEEVKKFQDRFTALFNFTELTVKWGPYEPVQGKPEWQKLQQKLDWCKQNGVTPKGHTIGWTNMSGTPAWLLKLPHAMATDLYKARIHNLVGGFKNQIHMWDVVNEPVTTVPWEKALQDSIFGESKIDEGSRYNVKDITLEETLPWVENSYRWAKEADPKGDFILNEFYVIAKPSVREKFYQLLKTLQQRNAPVTGIGIQAHEPREMWFSPVEIQATFDKYQELNLPLHITEFIPQSSGKAITGGWREGVWTEDAQAEFAEQFYTLAFGHPSMVSIHWWGLSDRMIWLKGGGLLDKDFNPKPVYTRLLQLIKEDWMTKNLSLTTDKTGEVNFRGFYGNYQVTITKPDGNKQTTSMHLREKAVNSQTFICK